MRRLPLGDKISQKPEKNDDCVTAKTSSRVKCKTLSCSAIVANYKIDLNEYYYAKRGCTSDPEAEKTNGEQYPADEETVPRGLTGIKQYNQQTVAKNGNTLRKVSIIKIYSRCGSNNS